MPWGCGSLGCWLCYGNGMVCGCGYANRDMMLWGGGHAMGTWWPVVVGVPWKWGGAHANRDIMAEGGGHVMGTWCPCR